MRSVGVKQPDAASDKSDFDLLGFVVTAAVGALVSVAVKGFVFGIVNNIFHLPIVAALFDEPQFAHDAFIQSLRYFASGFWLLLRGAGRFVDAYWLFLSLHVLSRFVAFAGFLACADLLGVRRRSDRALFAAILCVTPLMQNTSLAGGGGLFMNYFTHSEIDNGLTLFVLYLLLRGRLAASLVLNGLVFFVNAFIGVWNIPMIVATTSAMLLQRTIGRRRVIVEGTAGIIAAGLVSTPVVWNVLRNPDFGKPLGFDYVAFLEGYFPYHFLIWDDPGDPKERIAAFDRARLCRLRGARPAGPAVRGRSLLVRRRLCFRHRRSLPHA